MKTSLDRHLQDELKDSLQPIHGAFRHHYPGDRPDRQPVHTVYGGAHLFRADSARKLGDNAQAYLERYAPEASSLAAALEIDDPEVASLVHARVLDKLAREPVEDFRIDFEDGYGNRPDAEEDACAVAAAAEVAAGMSGQSLPPFMGIRIKPFSADLMERGVRTLDLFLTALLDRSGGVLPGGFVVTLPKVIDAGQVAALATMLERIESAYRLDSGAVSLEIMVETTQAILDQEGSCPLGRFVEAAGGRCTGAHFGVYDYTASCGITAAHQTMGHPACEHARQVMQQALAGTGVWLSDGATNVLPVPPHRAPAGSQLNHDQLAENRVVVHAAWRLHYGDVRHSLATGFYQGWDLHPAQLVSRFAALNAFFQEGRASASQRLGNFVSQAAQATLVGDVFDDAATGQALLNYFLRGLNCGAITVDEVCATGLSVQELESRSFLQIIEGRRG